MIIDRIGAHERYYPLHPLFEHAFAFLAETPDLEPGHYELGDGMYANIFEMDTKPIQSLDLEAHRRYIDLFYCVAGGERMAWANVEELQMLREDDEHDIAFYGGNSTSVSIRPGMFYIMLPGDAHKSGAHHEFPKHVKKVVVKIPVEA